jgi:hypothetical protein
LINKKKESKVFCSLAKNKLLSSNAKNMTIPRLFVLDKVIGYFAIKSADILPFNKINITGDSATIHLI